MGFRINTNIAAMDAHRNSVMTNKGLDKSLQSLSSGLRINVAADDSSGMVIADALRSQALGLGQAINNANDGVAVVQTADGALDEYIKIINTVRTKSIQAASDGQNTDSRAAIQADIDRLLEAADSIANTTQFNGQKLLDGTFTNKAFHIGAYAGETVSLSVGNVQTDSVGGVTSMTGNATRADFVNATDLSESASGYALSAEALTINGTDVSTSLNTLSPTRLTDAASVAAAITDATGLVTDATNVVTAAGAIAGGSIAADTMKINGVAIAATTVVALDADGALVRAINDISDQTGVTASLDVNKKLVLESDNGQNISITNSTVTAATAQIDSGILTGAITAGSITATVDGSTLGATAYGTSHVATMTALAAAIQGEAGVATAVYTAATNTSVITETTTTWAANDTITWTDAGGTAYTGTSGGAITTDALLTLLASDINAGTDYTAAYTAGTDTLVITDVLTGEVANGAFSSIISIGTVDNTANLNVTGQTAVADSLVVTGAADGTAFTLSLDSALSTGF